MRTRTILALGVGWEDVLGEDSITAENRVDEENHFEDFFFLTSEHSGSHVQARSPLPKFNCAWRDTVQLSKAQHLLN